MNFPIPRHLPLSLGGFRQFLKLLHAKIYGGNLPVTLSVWSAPDRVSWDEAQRGNYRPAKLGEQLGPQWSTHWIRVEYELPQDWAGREVWLNFSSLGEGCVWIDGVPRQGLTGAAWGPQEVRSYYCITERARGGERDALFIEIACNSLFGLGGDPKYFDSIVYGKLNTAQIVWRDRAAWDVYWDGVVLADALEHLPEGSLRRGEALDALHRFWQACKLDDPQTWRLARAEAAKFLTTRNGDSAHELSAIGHAHIDTAWLWPLAETRRKCVRTFSTALRMMERYPDYKFVCSQAQQWSWMKELQPELFAEIKVRVKEGRFIPAGGTWIEPDCNIPSGESLVRQFLYGQLFFREELGITCREFWNPDVFGYSAAIPQIMNSTGIRRFLTQKLSWNQFNKPAHSTFWWEGLDGSRVLTHFPPADTYNSMGDARDVLASLTKFKDHDRSRESYLLFGFGDGGGGPTDEMLEQLERLRDVDGFPRVEIRTPSEFFERVERDGDKLTVWVGELYFELHRGTYTTQAANKRDNRRAEEAMREVEFLATLAVSQHAKYPTSEIRRTWEKILLNQFHDIIPGSSIAEVYEDSARDYREVFETTNRLRDESLTTISSASASDSLIINPLWFARRELVTLTDQQSPVVVNALPFSVAKIEPKNSVKESVAVSENADGFLLENTFLKVTLTRSGEVRSLFDKRAQRETIANDELGNRFVIFDDVPHEWEAWDVDLFHLEHPNAVTAAKSAQIVVNDPLVATVEFYHELSAQSWLRQRVSLNALDARLEVACEVEWRESKKFLKVEFPVDVRSEFATYEIQFGHVRRPTHFNTSWDYARFEVCAHRWIDFSEASFGVALLNDSKYGHAVHGNVMRLSLLRSPKLPDANADMGRHHFRYAIVPHSGDWRSAGVLEQAAAFNQPLTVISGRSPLAAESATPLFVCDNPAIIIDTIKRSEDGNATIVRLYEAHGGRQRGALKTRLPLTTIQRANLLEEAEGEPLTANDGSIFIELRPFEILTLRIANG